MAISIFGRRRRRPARHHGLAPLVLLALALGCGRGDRNPLEVYPAAGSLTFRGRAPEGAFVALHPKTPLPGSPRPHGVVAADGTFTLSTYELGDGAPSGEYSLTVQQYRPVVVGGDVQPGPNVLPPKYASPDSSGVTVTIAPRRNHLEPILLR